MRFFKQDKGSIAIIVGLLFVACIGFAALSIDVGIWYQSQRKLQLGADAGAIGGAIALSSKGPSTVIPEATYDINLNGCSAGNNCTIVINNPPTSGPNTGNEKSVEVKLSRPADLYLAGLFLSTGPILHARAVAGQKDSKNCLTALGTSGIVVNVKGGGVLDANNCGVYSNSSASNSINVVGGGVINAEFVKTVGDVNTAGGGVINSETGITTGASPTTDPFTSLTVPTTSGCTETNYQLNSATATITPGTYCEGIKLVSSANLIMSPGTYVIKGSFDASGQSTITGNGVTIILTSDSSGKYGTINFNAGLNATLSAPTTIGDPFQGVLFYGDRAAPSNLDHKLVGGSGQLLSGVAYFPTTNLEYGGQTTQIGNPCFRIIALTVTLVGGAGLGTGCPVNGGPIVLFE